MYIQVYIFWIEMSHRIHFWYRILLKMLFFFEKMAENYFFGPKFCDKLKEKYIFFCIRGMGFNPCSPKGGCNNPQTFFDPVLKNMQPSLELLYISLSSSFPLILRKKFQTYRLLRGRVSFRRGECNPMILKFGYYWKYLKWYVLRTLFAS